MRTLTNNGVNPRGLLTVTIEPGATVPASEALINSEGVQELIKAKILVVGGEADEPADDEADPELAEKEALVAELEALGVKKTTRTSLDNLRAALDEAKKGK